LAGHNFDKITPDLRANILAFYADPSAPIATKKKPADWQKTEGEVEKLRTLPEDAPGSKTTSEIRSDGAEAGEVSRKLSSARP
jgi:hypothetical protein